MNFSTEESLLVPEGDSLKEAFTAHLVLPDVVNIFPEAKLLLSYSDHVSIELGNLVMPEYVDTKPTITMEMFNEKKFYTLIMTDPDVPNRAMPSDREFLHWMVTNITGNSLKRGEEVVEYEAPLPKKGSGLHRYVFVLLEQSKPIVFDKTSLDWSVSERSSLILDNEQNVQTAMSNQLNIGSVKRSSSTKDRPSGVQSSRLSSPPKFESSTTSKSMLDKSDKNQEPQTQNEGAANNNSKSVKEAPNLFSEEKKRGLLATDAKLVKGVDQKGLSVQSSILKPNHLGDMTIKSVSGVERSMKAVDQKSSTGQQLSKQNTVEKQQSNKFLTSPAAEPQKSSEEKETAAAFQRTKFSTKDFITKYLIRSVAAGNFFQTEFNDYVGEKLTKSVLVDKEKQTEKLTTVMSTTTTASSTTKTIMTTLEKKIERTHDTSTKK